MKSLTEKTITIIDDAYIENYDNRHGYINYDMPKDHFMQFLLKNEGRSFSVLSMSSDETVTIRNPNGINYPIRKKLYKDYKWKNPN